jgi:uncharacterized protein YaaN involved in tellurite resistance
MTQETQTEAKAVQTELAALAPALPLPVLAEPDLAGASAPQAAEITRRMAEIDLANSLSVLSFGTKAQSELQSLSQEMLQGVKTKDLGPAGEALAAIVATIKGFSGAELDPSRDRSWWEKLTGAATPLVQFIERYEEVQTQIDKITTALLSHQGTLLKDIKALDLLYGRTLAFFDELGLYLAAGKAKLAEIDTKVIPEAEAAVTQAAPEDQVKAAQVLRDLRALRDDLDRRLMDLALTRQVTMQSLPSIRLVQENDKSLVGKITSTLLNTVPLWETQLAQALTIQRSREAAGAIKAASDLTNDLLTRNAQNLQEANRTVRSEMERGVFDITAVQAANDTLIATIQDSLRLADEGKARRAAAEADLAKMEVALRDTLASAKARGG